MKRDVALWQFGGFSLSALGGTLLHFLYDWTDKNPVAALFSGVNESTWEHMKLLFFSLFFFALVQSRFFRERKDFWWMKMVGILTGLIFIPVLFYTYNGAFGPSPDWLNITIFFIATAAAFGVEYLLLRTDRLPVWQPWIGFVAVCLVGGLFVLLTFYPPYLPLFHDPVTGQYGIGR